MASLFISTVTFSSAQQIVEYDRGVSAQFHSGITYIDFNGLRNYLNNPAALTRVRMPYTLFTDNGAEWTVVKDRLAVGGGFQTTNSAPISIDSIAFDFDAVGGFIKIGYHYVQTTTAFAYTYLGLGTSGAFLTVTNLTNSINHGAGYPMLPRENVSYTNGLFFVDAGTGYKLVFTPEGSRNVSGLTVGIDGGCKLYISDKAPNATPQVNRDDRPVETHYDPNSRTVLVPYVQMSIGFSSFKTKP